MDKIWYWVIGVFLASMIVGQLFPVPKDYSNLDNISNINITGEINNDSSIKEINDSTTVAIYVVKDQFSNVDVLHWTHMPLTYYINTSGYVNQNDPEVEKRVGFIKDAMTKVSDAIPSINFIEENNFSKADIKFSITIPPFLVNGKSDAGIYEFNIGIAETNITENYIVGANVYISRPTGSCVDSNVATHELLHALGLEHSYESQNDIMYPEIYVCNPFRKISAKDISCLKYIYSNGQFNGNCSEVNFLSGESLWGCGEGWYPVEGTNYCCQEPNMIIDEEGYCDYS